jgi:hypothetical protein
MRMNDHTVMTTTATARTVTSAPIIEKTAASNGVLSLKCDGTPRHLCIEMRATSPTEQNVSVPSTIHPAALGGRRRPMTQLSVTSARPKDRPKTTGLRQETGPAHGPPSTR